jgi:hypothetical protein
MEMGGQLHASAVLPSEKEPLISTYRALDARAGLNATEKKKISALS